MLLPWERQLIRHPEITGKQVRAFRDSFLRQQAAMDAADTNLIWRDGPEQDELGRRASREARAKVPNPTAGRHFLRTEPPTPHQPQARPAFVFWEHWFVIAVLWGCVITGLCLLMFLLMN